MCPSDGKAGSPAAQVAPLKIFAKDPRGLTEQVIRDLAPPFHADAGAAAVRATAGPDAFALQFGNELATASPDEICELGLTAGAMGIHAIAIEAFGECVKREPNHAIAWRKLAELLRLSGKDAEARDADAAADKAMRAGDKGNPARDLPLAKVKKSERKLRERLEGRETAEVHHALRNHLLANPLDAAAMALLAHLEPENGLTRLHLLERALDLCPDFVEAREDYVELLSERRAHAAVVAQTKLLLAHAPRNKNYRYSYALAMVRSGDLDGALDTLAGLVHDHPGETDYWLLYAQTLRFVGRRDDGVHAYRQCLKLRPDMGGAWWGLADLKGDLITEADIVLMQTRLEGTALDPDSRMRMLYALAHTLERAGDFAASFAAYDEAASLARAISRERRKGIGTSQSVEYLKRMNGVFSRDNLVCKLAPAAMPATADTPIFIVGMPRAGSTLVEQILASHSQVEGTRELTLIGEITRDLAMSRTVAKGAYPECVLDLGCDELTALGNRYLEGARVYRKSTRPYFVDKRPWNWLEVGFIHLILPHAKIIDIRREPMAACFAMFKQLLPDDARFSNDLEEVGRYYNNYVAMMEHWQTVLPGRVHSLSYERLVEDTENEIRRMLDYCGLSFEESCLRFWETKRAIATPSAEQVRRPIFRDALEQWRNFEPWLGPLKAALSQPANV